MLVHTHSHVIVVCLQINIMWVICSLFALLLMLLVCFTDTNSHMLKSSQIYAQTDVTLTRKKTTTTMYGFLAGHTHTHSPCSLLSVCVLVCEWVSGDSGPRGSVIPGSALTLYQQFSLHISTKATGLAVATVMALVLPPCWLPPSFNVGESVVFPPSRDDCLDPRDRAVLGQLCFSPIKETSCPFFTLL